MLRTWRLSKRISPSGRLGSFKSVQYARWSSRTPGHPLRVLFCGSDAFSVTSLKVFQVEAFRDPNFIRSIDVVCRPGKRVGRGLKTVREVPIKSAAEQLGFPVHEIDDPKQWQPSDIPGEAFDIVIAVSFGLLIPARVINAARYGGINVHPSLLPDLRGPAPIQHAIIQDRTEWGVTIQTLHPTRFDRGRILLQDTVKTRVPPDLDFSEDSGGGLTKEFGRVLGLSGAGALAVVLREGLYLPSSETQDKGSDDHDADRSETHTTPHDPLRHAPKITQEDRRIDWRRWTWRDLCLRHGALGRLWDDTTYQACHPDGATKRVVFHALEPLTANNLTPEHANKFEAWRDRSTPGEPALLAQTKTGGHIPVETPSDGAPLQDLASASTEQFSVCVATAGDKPEVLRVQQCTVDSGPRGMGQHELASLLLRKVKQASEAGPG